MMGVIHFQCCITEKLDLKSEDHNKLPVGSLVQVLEDSNQSPRDSEGQADLPLLGAEPLHYPQSVATCTNMVLLQTNTKVVRRPWRTFML